MKHHYVLTLLFLLYKDGRKGEKGRFHETAQANSYVQDMNMWKAKDIINTKEL